ncbi:MAG: DUF5652 family protein [Patescibacteria group bacterium]|nr:DUF5652 family protein [Patescibacteria group bacterium]
MNFFQDPFSLPAWFFWPIMIWVLIWKGLALWRAARNNQQIWFVILLIVNTLGLLEILYLFIISKKQTIEQPRERL